MIYQIKITFLGNSLAVQWLGLGVLTAQGQGSIPGLGTKISQAARRSQKRKKKITFLEVLRNKGYIINYFWNIC